MTYVKAVAFLYTPLVASIGINSGVETIKGKKDDECVEKH